MREIRVELTHVLLVSLFLILEAYQVVLKIFVMSSQTQYITAAVASAGALAGVYYIYCHYKRSERAIPTEWKQVGTLSNIYVYPIKSCGPVILDTAECSLMGLKSGWLRDRFLMVVDEKNNFTTARAHPDLLTVHPQVRKSILTLNHFGIETLHVNLAEVIALQTPEMAKVWGVPVPVLDCGSEANEWFTRIINKPTENFRLVYYASQQSREVRENNANNKFYKFKRLDGGALPDELAFNLINESSIADLNKRLKECKVTHRNFRPNFVLSGAKAFDEDNWKFIKIGKNVFEIIKPCTRCLLTTIDPETGVRYSKIEPLETLKGYRQIEDPEERRSSGHSPRMGVQLALRSGPGGLVSLSDPIYAA